MNAREQILSSIRARRRDTVRAPTCWRAQQTSEDLVSVFEQRAKAAAARVRILALADEIPAAIADVLRLRNLPAIVHLPPDPVLGRITWSDASGLLALRDPPGPDHTAVSLAQAAIAETGTLVYAASAGRPPSWHFRPGLEISILATDNIFCDLESVLTRMKDAGALPSTINLVTGPSRTGDIEQTLELGAHGPRELVILIVPSLDVKPA